MSADQPVKEFVGGQVSAAKQMSRPINVGRVGTELYPLIFFVGITVVGAAAFAISSLFRKNDVVIKHHATIPPWERMDLEHPKPGKFLTFNQRYDQVKPEIAKLIKEMNEADMKK
ncbi:hypothetical protein QYM36_006853 [Artemia franciscana]|uniref:Uncharacterized protein n=1 Tax=Artemia franciscana TaxID=6661 RepID=A0AA88L8N8_ARTSF|nr:hypothetical protein QYM36_006853 [Artemia franciscana]